MTSKLYNYFEVYLKSHKKKQQLLNGERTTEDSGQSSQ